MHVAWYMVHGNKQHVACSMVYLDETEEYVGKDCQQQKQRDGPKGNLCAVVTSQDERRGEGGRELRQRIKILARDVGSYV